VLLSFSTFIFHFTNGSTITFLVSLLVFYNVCIPFAAIHSSLPSSNLSPTFSFISSISIAGICLAQSIIISIIIIIIIIIIKLHYITGRFNSTTQRTQFFSSKTQSIRFVTRNNCGLRKNQRQHRVQAKYRADGIPYIAKTMLEQVNTKVAQSIINLRNKKS
jgi:hypothetical protein